MNKVKYACVGVVLLVLIISLRQCIINIDDRNNPDSSTPDVPVTVTKHSTVKQKSNNTDNTPVVAPTVTIVKYKSTLIIQYSDVEYSYNTVTSTDTAELAVTPYREFLDWYKDPNSNNIFEMHSVDAIKFFHKNLITNVKVNIIEVTE